MASNPTTKDSPLALMGTLYVWWQHCNYKTQLQNNICKVTNNVNRKQLQQMFSTHLLNLALRPNVCNVVSLLFQPISSNTNKSVSETTALVITMYDKANHIQVGNQQLLRCSRERFYTLFTFVERCLIKCSTTYNHKKKPYTK